MAMIAAVVPQALGSPDPLLPQALPDPQSNVPTGFLQAANTTFVPLQVAVVDVHPLVQQFIISCQLTNTQLNLALAQSQQESQEIQRRLQETIDATVNAQGKEIQLEADRAALLKINHELGSCISGLLKQHNAHNWQLGQLQDQLQLLTNDYSIKETKIAELEMEIRAKDAVITDKIVLITKEAHVIAELTAETWKKDAEINDQKVLIANKDAKIDDQNVLIATGRGIINKLQMDLEKATNDQAIQPGLNASAPSNLIGSLIDKHHNDTDPALLEARTENEIIQDSLIQQYQNALGNALLKAVETNERQANELQYYKASYEELQNSDYARKFKAVHNCLNAERKKNEQLGLEIGRQKMRIEELELKLESQNTLTVTPESPP